MFGSRYNNNFCKRCGRKAPFKGALCAKCTCQNQQSQRLKQFELLNTNRCAKCPADGCELYVCELQSPTSRSKYGTHCGNHNFCMYCKTQTVFDEILCIKCKDTKTQKN